MLILTQHFAVLLCLIALGANAAPPKTPLFKLVDTNGTIIGQVAGTVFRLAFLLLHPS